MYVMGLGGPGEDHQLHHCCWTGRVGEREGEEEDVRYIVNHLVSLCTLVYTSNKMSVCNKNI